MSQRFEHQMAFYQAYHHHPHNKATHFIGVPLIIYALLLLMSFVQFPLSIMGVPVTLALVFLVAVFIYHLILDGVFALVLVVGLLALLGLAQWTHAVLPSLGCWIAFALTFIVGWTFQLVGHGIEGRRPALVDNIWQIFIAPMFLVAEVFFHLGYRTSMQQRILEKSRAFTPGNGTH